MVRVRLWMVNVIISPAPNPTRVQKNRVFFKKAQPGWVLGVLLGFGFQWVFSDEQCRMMSNIHGRGK